MTENRKFTRIVEKERKKKWSALKRVIGTGRTRDGADAKFICICRGYIPSRTRTRVLFYPGQWGGSLRRSLRRQGNIVKPARDDALHTPS